MPRPIGSTKTPSYRYHKSSDQAVVTLSGTDHYLGSWNSKSSKAEYDRLVAEWLANGRGTKVQAVDFSVAELIAGYWKYVEGYYLKDGRPTSEQGNIRLALRPLKQLYGSTSAADFGPLSLKAVRDAMIEKGWVRNQVNKSIDRVKRMFRWAVENERVPSSIYHGLQAVPGLRAGRSQAAESEPVRPVPDVFIAAVLPYVPAPVKAMIELQLLTGVRPGEACHLRGRDLDTTGTLWSYRPASHKTQHHGHVREVYLGPRAQEVVRPFLKSDLAAYLFSPAEAEAARRQAQHAVRKRPLSHGNRPGSNRRRRPQWKPGPHYTTESYCRAITRACEKAFAMPAELLDVETDNAEQAVAKSAQRRQWRVDHSWHPHQLRHNAATYLRKEYGLEAAQVILGHKSMSVTEIYAEKDMATARKVMSEVG